LKDDGSIPNNSRLPLLIYKRALNPPAQDPASAIEGLLGSNKWGGCWRNGIYSFHHYHSTAHEALLVYRGSAEVQLGGKSGIVETIEPGDVLIIPAGVGHKNLGDWGDFGIIGAYPAGQSWDLCYGKPGERPRTDENIARVPLPKADPVFGDAGPMMKEWGLKT
jgi:uncharacterized protein YjlB